MHQRAGQLKLDKNVGVVVDLRCFGAKPPPQPGS